MCLLFLQNIVHELRITNQVIYLNPPIEECRYKLYQEMFSWKMVILSLPRIQSQRYQVSVMKLYLSLKNYFHFAINCAQHLSVLL